MKLAFSLFAVLLPLISFSQMDTLSHSLGVILAKSVSQQGFEVKDVDAFTAGFKSVLDGNVSPADVQAANAVVQQAAQAAQMKAQAAAKEVSAQARKEGEEFLAKNAMREEVTTTTSGLQYEVLTKGNSDAHPAATDKVTVHYTGTNLDGSVFDSSVERGQPATFPLNGVIAGWTEGVQLMSPGDKFRFYIPSDLAYGERGAGEDIAPGATLIFDVELISINGK